MDPDETCKIIRVSEVWVGPLGGGAPSKSEARTEAIVVMASDSENQIMARIPIERDWSTGKATLGATEKFRDEQIFPADFSTAE